MDCPFFMKLIWAKLFFFEIESAIFVQYLLSKSKIDCMKNAALFLVKLVINMILIAAGYFLYTMFVRPLAQQTVMPLDFQEIFALVLLLIGLPVLSMKRFGFFRGISFGMMAVLIPALLFGILHLNLSASTRSYVRTFPIESNTKQNNELVLGAYVYEKSSIVHFNVPENNCLELDSMRIRIVDGVLGMKVVTNDINIGKKPNCGG